KEAESVRDRLLDPGVSKELVGIFENAQAWHLKTGNVRMRETPAVWRFVALTGLILWAAKQPETETQGVNAQISALLQDPKRLAKDVEAELERIAVELEL